MSDLKAKEKSYQRKLLERRRADEYGKTSLEVGAGR